MIAIVGRIRPSGPNSTDVALRLLPWNSGYVGQSCPDVVSSSLASLSRLDTASNKFGPSGVSMSQIQPILTHAGPELAECSKIVTMLANWTKPGLRNFVHKAFRKKIRSATRGAQTLAGIAAKSMFAEFGPTFADSGPNLTETGLAHVIGHARTRAESAHWTRQNSRTSTTA